MTQTLTLPSLNPIPDDIDEQLRRLLQGPSDPALEPWLVELIKNSGHLSTSDDLRWRVMSIVWLATQFDAEQAWPYLMWLNMNEPVMSDHLGEILAEAANDLDCYVQLANWIANTQDERLSTFFSEFSNIPPARKIPSVLSKLLARPIAPETGVWLSTFCRDTRGHVSPHLRRWCMLTAAWYATCFNASEGLTYLKQFSNGAESLTGADTQTLMDTASEINGISAVTQWIADCSDPTIKAMLKEFGHPDLTTVSQDILQQPPDYDYLTGSASQAAADVEIFQRSLDILAGAGISLKSVKILDLACGLLAPRSLLFNSAGFSTVGVDVHIPPRYLPLPGLKYWPKRRKHVKAWQKATAPYYQALAQLTGLKLKWNNVKIKLADLTRLNFPDTSFVVVTCVNYLQHAPNVEAVLAEAARVLKPGGLLLADIRPYPSLTGAFQAPEEATSPWRHLHDHYHNPAVPLNKWRERQYQTAIEKLFTIDQWLTEQDEQAVALLTPEIQADLADYSQEELTRQLVVILAKKKW
jgi:SAM-dependent methyltransferase